MGTWRRATNSDGLKGKVGGGAGEGVRSLQTEHGAERKFNSLALRFYKAREAYVIESGGVSGSLAQFAETLHRGCAAGSRSGSGARDGAIRCHNFCRTVVRSLQCWRVRRVL